MPVIGNDFALIEPYLSAVSSRQSFSFKEAKRLVEETIQNDGAFKVLDLGCGAGKSCEQFRKVNGAIQWFGLDISDSFEVLNRGALRLAMCTFDGINIPVEANCVDLVYSHQVFEHVRNPVLLISEVFRILKPEGSFIGSTSHLEPFHSRSYWNYTPYGFATLLEAAGFGRIRIRPGIDGFTLGIRRLCSYLKMSMLFEPFFLVESPLNLVIEALRVLRISSLKRNALKLVFSGHFVFEAYKTRKVLADLR